MRTATDPAPQAAAPPDAPEEREGPRGQEFTVWTDGRRVVFYWFQGHEFRVILRAPLAWHFAQDPLRGPVLRDAWGRYLLAWEALELARAGRRGFTVKAEYEGYAV